VEEVEEVNVTKGHQLKTPALVVALAVLGSAVVANAQTTRDSAACESLKTLQVPGVALSITKAEWFVAGPAPAPGGRQGVPPPPAVMLPA